MILSVHCLPQSRVEIFTHCISSKDNPQMTFGGGPQAKDCTSMLPWKPGVPQEQRV